MGMSIPIQLELIPMLTILFGMKIIIIIIIRTNLNLEKQNDRHSFKDMKQRNIHTYLNLNLCELLNKN